MASVRGIMKYQSLNELTSENRWCSRANEREREKLRTAGHLGCPNEPEPKFCCDLRS